LVAVAIISSAIGGYLAADSDDPGQGFQLKAATIPIEGGQYWPVGTFMGSQRW
jgi:hypothetical protein